MHTVHFRLGNREMLLSEVTHVIALTCHTIATQFLISLDCKLVVTLQTSNLQNCINLWQNEFVQPLTTVGFVLQKPQLI